MSKYGTHVFRTSLSEYEDTNGNVFEMASPVLLT